METLDTSAPKSPESARATGPSTDQDSGNSSELMSKAPDYGNDSEDNGVGVLGKKERHTLSAEEKPDLDIDEESAECAALPLAAGIKSKRKKRCTRKNVKRLRNGQFAIASYVESKTSFCDLPLEMIAAILKQLDFVDLLRAARVCRAFNEVAQFSWRETVVFHHACLPTSKRKSYGLSDTEKEQVEEEFKAMYRKTAGPKVKRVVLAGPPDRYCSYRPIFDFSTRIEDPDLSRFRFLKLYPNLQEVVVVNLAIWAGDYLGIMLKYCPRLVLENVSLGIPSFSKVEHDGFVHVPIPHLALDNKGKWRKMAFEALDRYVRPMHRGFEKQIISGLPRIPTRLIRDLLKCREPEFLRDNPGMVLDAKALRSFKPWTRRILLLFENKH